MILGGEAGGASGGHIRREGSDTLATELSLSTRRRDGATRWLFSKEG